MLGKAVELTVAELAELVELVELQFGQVVAEWADMWFVERFGVLGL